jgi:hypothetical protein
MAINPNKAVIVRRLIKALAGELNGLTYVRHVRHLESSVLPISDHRGG